MILQKRILALEDVYTNLDYCSLFIKPYNIIYQCSTVLYKMILQICFAHIYNTSVLYVK